MMRLPFRRVAVIAVCLLLIVLPAMVQAQSGSPPPVAPPLVREGDFAVKMASALGLTTTGDEVEAETKLGEIGIIPRNGWIADYPVTPDIIGELQEAVRAAADSGKLSMTGDEALKRMDDIAVGFGLSTKPYAQGESYKAGPPDADSYPNPTVINNYYYSSGPPVVTYYSPPPDYYYLYSWVPYPFWWVGFWFPGFYVLNDFHRVAVVNHRTVFISNHFNDIGHHRVFRIDPVERNRGRTYSGIGISHPRNFMSTGVPRGARTIFNRPHERAAPGSRIVSPTPQGGKLQSPSPPRGEKRITGPPSRGGEKTKLTPREGRGGDYPSPGKERHEGRQRR